MELKKINQLMIAMGKYGIQKLALKKDGEEIILEKSSGSVRPYVEEPRVEPQYSAPTTPTTVDEPEGVYISSPMIGTLYHAPSPKDAPFVRVGDRVTENSVVCLIEAMKVLNEVKAGLKGVVAEILVDNGQIVEFGAPLIRIIPQ